MAEAPLFTFGRMTWQCPACWWLNLAGDPILRT